MRVSVESEADMASEMEAAMEAVAEESQKNEEVRWIFLSLKFLRMCSLALEF